jgi:hypothetical protein
MRAPFAKDYDTRYDAGVLVLDENRILYAGPSD